MRLVLIAAFVLARTARVAALEPVPDKLVVLTFDDSVKSHHSVVAPILKKHGFGATFFITEGFDFPTNKRDYMTWDEIKALHADGFEIGNHTRDHFVVNANNVDRLREQVEHITLRCREHGIPDPVSFAWPGNGIDEKALPVLSEAGIRWARRGGAPEYPYAEGKGFAFEPGKDHPLLIPSAGDARPGWTLDDFRAAVEQARGGRIAVLQFHGAPDTAHQWVNLPREKFEDSMQHLKDGGYRVIAMRDLAKYVDPANVPAKPTAIIAQRREELQKSDRAADAELAAVPEAIVRANAERAIEEFRHLANAIPEAAGRFVADARVFEKGLDWAVRYDRDFTIADRRLLERAAKRGGQRFAALLDGQTPWRNVKGKLVHGYVSKVDGSVQPYGVIIPAKYDPKVPMRLDVVLHGSTKPVGLSELRFMARFDEGDVGASFVPDVPYIELHPLGRVENCYRWAGETDVFEAIEDVCRRYNVDRRRIVLRGMSMGASGTWHLGLKHSGFFAALGPYCGYVDTHRFSETPLPNFVKVGPLPKHQELGLHMLDSIDYAANAEVVPVVAAMGEKDVFFDAHVLMGAAFRKEGLQLVNMISPGTGHVVDPVTFAEQMRQIAAHLEHRGPAVSSLDHDAAERARRTQPRDGIRFVTWTLKYPRCEWIELLGLEKHYSRAEIRATSRGDRIEIEPPANVMRFAIHTGDLPEMPKSVHIGAERIDLPQQAQAAGYVIRREADRWALAGELGKVQLEGKCPGLQGPIDDAFTSPFLCVRGTGTPWNPAVQRYADAALDRFAEEWRHYFRGECSIKKDVELTDEDLRTKNLILFGDPGSNRWIAKALPSLPISWTKETLHMAGSEYPATDHVPALIHPSPLTGAAEHYVVLNSGHTFRESELSRLNYLLFPRWGDWAVLRVSERQPAGEASRGADASLEEVLRAGYFDEEWK